MERFSHKYLSLSLTDLDKEPVVHHNLLLSDISKLVVIKVIDFQMHRDSGVVDSKLIQQCLRVGN